MTAIIRASQTGARLNSDVRTGGGTDDTAALQKALDTASQGDGVHLILDGAALVTGLVLHSNTTIECPDKSCGLFLADHVNGPILRNAHPDFALLRDRNIRLIGGTYHLNGAHQEHDVPRTPAMAALFGAVDDSVFADRHWTIGMEWFGVEELCISGVSLRDQCTFGMLLANWKHVTMTDMHIDLVHHVDGQNQDGIHFWGPGRFLTMRDIRGSSGDDFIALAPDEHDGRSDITDVLIDGVQLEEADQGIRLLSRREGRLDRVVIRNVSGTYRCFGFYINPWFPGHGGNYGSLVFDQIDLRPLEPNYIYRPPMLFQLGGCIESLIVLNVQDHLSRHPRVLFEISGPCYKLDEDKDKTHICSLTIEGLTIMQAGEAPCPIVTVDGLVDRMTLRNWDIACDEDRIQGVRMLPDGRIGRLLLSGISGADFQSLDPALSDTAGPCVLRDLSIAERPMDQGVCDFTYV